LLVVKEAPGDETRLKVKERTPQRRTLIAIASEEGLTMKFLFFAYRLMLDGNHIGTGQDEDLDQSTIRHVLEINNWNLIDDEEGEECRSTCE